MSIENDGQSFGFGCHVLYYIFLTDGRIVMKWIYRFAAASFLIVTPRFGAEAEMLKTVSIPEALAGAWYSKLVIGEKEPRRCDNPRTKLSGIRFHLDGRITAMDGSRSCRIEKVKFVRPGLSAPTVLVEWSYEAECRLHFEPSILSKTDPVWREFGEFKIVVKDGLELQRQFTDQDSSYFDTSKRSLEHMTYRRCQ